MLHPAAARLKKTFLRTRLRCMTGYAWRRRHRVVFGLHPGYACPAPRDLERKHLALWRQVRPRVSLDTIRVCYNISGIADPLNVPEEVFASEIEGAPNRDQLSLFLENKNYYSRWWPGRLFPSAYLHNIGGRFIDADFVPLDAKGVERVLREMEYPAVFKPAEGSGGRDVLFVTEAAALAELMRDRRDFVVQRRIEPHPFFRRFNEFGLNTVRVCVYRSVTTDVTHFLHAALRVGRAGKVDNLKQGGLVRLVRGDGTLNRFALDIYGGKFTEHPDSGMDLTVPEAIPKYADLKQVAVDIAEQMPMIRLVSFDFALDAEERWRPIEVNLVNQTIRFAQYAGRSSGRSRKRSSSTANGIRTGGSCSAGRPGRPARSGDERKSPVIRKRRRRAGRRRRIRSLWARRGRSRSRSIPRLRVSPGRAPSPRIDAALRGARRRGS